MVNKSVTQKQSLEQWLSENGFRDNPFDDRAFSAEGDDYLSECFVEFPYYDELLGKPGSSAPRFVFARRGGGKSTLRLQIQRQLEESQDSTRSTLTVTCDQFDVLCERVEWDTSKIRLRMHIEQIVGLIVTRLFELGVRKRPIVDLRSLEDNQRRFLRWYIDSFSHCLQPWQLNDLLGKLEGIFYFVSIENILKGTQKISAELAKALPGAPVVVETLNEIVRWRSPGVDKADVPNRDLLNKLLEICRGLGLEEVIILVDNVDMAQYAGEHKDFEPAFQLIHSLGAAVEVLRLPGLAIKFFLPEEILSQARCSFRFDIFKEHRIEWDRAALARILEQRLRFFSKGVYTSLSPLCEEELRSEIDEWLLDWAETPRDLLQMGNELLSQHFRFPSEEPLLTCADWQQAMRVVEARRHR